MGDDDLLAASDSRAATLTAILGALLALASVAHGQGQTSAVAIVADSVFPGLNFLLLVVVLVRLQVIRREQASVKSRLQQVQRMAASAGAKESRV